MSGDVRLTRDLADAIARDPRMTQGHGLTDSEWSDLMAVVPEDPSNAPGWEWSLLRRTIERIVNTRSANAAEPTTADTTGDTP